MFFFVFLPLGARAVAVDLILFIVYSFYRPNSIRYISFFRMEYIFHINCWNNVRVNVSYHNHTKKNRSSILYFDAYRDAFDTRSISAHEVFDILIKSATFLPTVQCDHILKILKTASVLTHVSP